MLGAVNITIRTEAEIKQQSEQVLHELGLTMTTAVNAFLRTIARQKRIPFELTLAEAEADPFFSETNQARLALSRKQLADGNLIYKTPQALGLDDE
jgi:DNA-damage-inducible protein J